MTYKVKAILKKLQNSPKKVRLVADQIRGLNANKAISSLVFVNKKSAQPILKLVKSAIANAENNFNLKKENLYIKEIFANEGPALKRWMPKALGVATPIKKRSTHLNIVLLNQLF